MTDFRDPTNTVSAVPPSDYQGTDEEWVAELKRRGHVNGSTDLNSHPDPEVTEEEWYDILKTCERA